MAAKRVDAAERVEQRAQLAVHLAGTFLVDDPKHRDQLRRHSLHPRAGLEQLGPQRSGLPGDGRCTLGEQLTVALTVSSSPRTLPRP